MNEIIKKTEECKGRRLEYWNNEILEKQNDGRME